MQERDIGIDEKLYSAKEEAQYYEYCIEEPYLPLIPNGIKKDLASSWAILRSSAKAKLRKIYLIFHTKYKLEKLEYKKYRRKGKYDITR